MLVCFNKLLTETFPKRYWSLSSGVKTCDLPDLEVASARLSLTFPPGLQVLAAPPLCLDAAVTSQQLMLQIGCRELEVQR